MTTRSEDFSRGFHRLPLCLLEVGALRSHVVDHLDAVVNIEEEVGHQCSQTCGRAGEGAGSSS